MDNEKNQQSEQATPKQVPPVPAPADHPVEAQPPVIPAPSTNVPAEIKPQVEPASAPSASQSEAPDKQQQPAVTAANLPSATVPMKKKTSLLLPLAVIVALIVLIATTVLLFSRMANPQINSSPTVITPTVLPSSTVEASPTPTAASDDLGNPDDDLKSLQSDIDQL